MTAEKTLRLYTAANNNSTLPAIKPERWMVEGICNTVDPELWFPEKGGSTKAAKRICVGCPIKQRCLDYALESGERFGVWGGHSERERRRLKRGEPANRPSRNGNGHSFACKCVLCQRIRGAA